MRKVAIITLFQNLEDEKDPDIDELDKQIRHVIESSSLSKLWRIDHVTFLDDIMTDLENHEESAKTTSIMNQSTFHRENHQP